MKSLFKIFALCMLLTFTFHSNAHLTMASKPGLFSNFSSSIIASSVDCDKDFAALAGRKIQPALMVNFHLPELFFPPFGSIKILRV